MSRRGPDLLHDPVGPTLLRLAGPMVLGIAAVVLFNVVDTFFVGRLGEAELAAMSFTFPVSLFVMSISMGMSVGATAVIARAIGQGDTDRVRRLTTDSLVLATGLVVIVAGIGWWTIDPLFRALGAGESELELVRSYMTPWYLGIGLLVIPMVGNGALRATGDTRTPSLIMMVAGLTNVVLDPLLIFGLGPFPRLGLQGAAIATVLAWVVTFVASLWLLGRREKMLCAERPALSTVLESWKALSKVAAPAAATNFLAPIGAGVLTRLAAQHGPAAVAAFGVGARLESLSLIGISALGTAVTPFAAQNLGAARCDRLRESLRFCLKAAVVYGLLLAALLFLLRHPIGRVFSTETEVAMLVASFLVLVPWSLAPYGLALLVTATFNAVGRPLRSMALVFLRLFVLAIPLAVLLSERQGMTGLFLSMALANLGMGLVSYLLVRRWVNVEEERLAMTGAPAPA
ncbi:MAG: MATE family efflux transporter [Acidobacteriota bacterium]